ncbi:TIGR03087 family PEP-CTERM/XrtA system glycosyltransferase [Thiorhodococcus mannitoliphagus]|uniref:TIGR03087 family PEP-CTERM/XrtA system glycosyltransferase n=1 Tax=Thiorhodococcus mannitoliphagus TaxID=329406 RepID=A0A6P1DSQ5_9GAMM|nr:TIGR03087 family PEP-CTERM/XrtA system glycosyltransferase [Thiorhodococcus mannitoliphagus]NEX19736.1 TIGR03087 family PEP-CTERM/XrtA system glycosyltransferase [Thiorhodococcus mannitoliphagus]
MEDLLFLVHRIPYPPNKGDKIRSFHLLRYLSGHYRVHLATFIDSKSDAKYRERLSHYCETTWFGTLSPPLAKLRSLIGLLKGEPLTLPYYRSTSLDTWIRDLLPVYPIRHVLVYSSGMAQFVLGHEFDGMRRLIDFVDVDSDKWRQYSLSKPFPMSWIYRREAERLADFERKVAARFDASLFVSGQEAALFTQGPGVDPDAVFVMRNGVDADYFSADPSRPSPFAGEGLRLVFTGAMDYWANGDGAIWFVESILPKVRRVFPQVEFHVVGMNPTPPVRALGQVPGVRVTGSVPDVRPYLQHATAVVVPLRIARGIQNKVLEAMSMGRPVVTTPQALEGIPAESGRHVLVAADPDAFVAQLVRLLSGGYADMGPSARALIERDFVWEASLERLLPLLGEAQSIAIGGKAPC